MCYNSSNYERIIRTYKEETRKDIDGTVKDFIKSIMEVRNQGYDSHQIPVHKNIGKDSKAGSGSHAWFYKTLIREKKYIISNRDDRLIQFNKKRKKELNE